MRRLEAVHPGAWWLWALGLALAASRTTNPLLLGLVVAVSGFVAASCRRPSPWSRAYATFLRIGLAALVLRVLLGAVAGAPVGTHTLVHLPQLDIGGTEVGGRVTGEMLASSAVQGLRLLAMLACLGAANVVTSPARLVKSLPAALHEIGLVVTVAVALAPQLVVSLRRVRAARRLRGRPTGGLAAVRGVAVPVLEGALDGALSLAAAMDARGYGRRMPVRAARRRASGVALGAGLLALGFGTAALLGGLGSGLGGPGVAVGAALATAGLVLGGARSPRTRYRPDAWSWRSTAVAGSGLLACAVLVRGGSDPLLLPDAYAAPPLPALAAVVLLLAALPGLLAPAPRLVPAVPQAVPA